MKRLFIPVVAMAMAATAAHSQERSAGLWLDHIPAVADTVAAKMYFALRPGTAASLAGTLRWDDTLYKDVLLGGTALQNGQNGNLVVADWHDRGATSASLIGLNGDTTVWALEFTTLPIVLIETSQKVLWELRKKDSEAKSPTYITVIDPLGRTFENVSQTDSSGNTTETDGPGQTVFSTDARIKVRGATSAGKPKKPFAVELTDDGGDEHNVHLLGYRSDGDWILDAAYNDPSRMRNRLITDIWKSVDDLPYDKDNDYQRNGTDGEYVEVFMHGQYWGLYCLTDKIDRKKLNLKKTKDEGLSTETTRGMLWKSLFRCSATTFSSYTEDPLPGKLTWEETSKDVTWEQKYPDDRDDQGDFRPIAEAIDCVGRAASDQTMRDSLAQKFYIGNLIDYHIFTQALQMQDNLQKNMYVSVRNATKNHRLLLTPWDLDATLGRSAGGGENIDNTDWYAFGQQLGGINYLFWRLGKSSYTAYKEQFYNRWTELKAGALCIDSIRQRMTEYADLMVGSGAFARESELWSEKLAPDLYEEIDYVCNFLTTNYAYFDEEMKEWGYGSGGTIPDTPDNPGTSGTPSLPDAVESVEIHDTEMPYGTGLAVRIVTLQADTVYVMFLARPKITFDGTLMTVTSDDGERSWEIANVDYFDFAEIDNPDPSGITLAPSGHDGTATARYFTLDGVETTPQNLRPGVYIVKIGRTTLKLTKKN